jgi:hypothetical protein
MAEKASSGDAAAPRLGSEGRAGAAATAVAATARGGGAGEGDEELVVVVVVVVVVVGSCDALEAPLAAGAPLAKFAVLPSAQCPFMSRL